MNNKAANLAVIHNEMHSASKVINLSLYQRSNAVDPAQDLQQLIESFCQHIQNIVPHRAYGYRHAELGLDMKEGGSAVHSCIYALTFEGQDLGELKLMRHYPFEDIELDFVEMLFCCLVFPLHSAVVSYKALSVGYDNPRAQTGKIVPMNGRL